MICELLSGESESANEGNADESLFRYPPRMIPGCHVTIHTTAKDDRDARLLLTQIGIPFFGKKIN